MANEHSMKARDDMVILRVDICLYGDGELQI